MQFLWKQLIAALIAIPVLTAGALAANDTLRVGIPGFPSLGMNPLTSTNLPALYTYAAVYDALTWVDNEGKALPQAAESWSSLNETTWQFKLKPGQTFTDETPLNAEAVKFAAICLKARLGPAIRSVWKCLHSRPRVSLMT